MAGWSKQMHSQDICLSRQDANNLSPRVHINTQQTHVEMPASSN